MNMKCTACGYKYKWNNNSKVVHIPMGQECPKCKRWTGEPDKEKL